MRFTTIALVAISLIGSYVSADSDIDIKFHKWANTDCSGHELGDADKIDDNHCQNFDHEFMSFKYQATIWNQMNFYHNDYSDPGCFVVVYDEFDCQGYGNTLGPFATTALACGTTLRGRGRSAGVYCGTTVAPTGAVPPFKDNWKVEDP